MQCLVPYYAIGFGVILARLFESTVRWQQGVAVVLALFLVGWNVVHIATFEKSFLRKADEKAVAAYLNEHDKNDFALTNLLADGPIQYYFQRHLQPVPDDRRWAMGQYRTMLGRIGPDEMLCWSTHPRRSARATSSTWL